MSASENFQASIRSIINIMQRLLHDAVHLVHAAANGIVVD
jgi:hypothetical protein